MSDLIEKVAVKLSRSYIQPDDEYDFHDDKNAAEIAIKTVLEEILKPSVGMTSSGAAPMTLNGIDAKTAFQWSDECMKNHIEAFADKHNITIGGDNNE